MATVASQKRKKGHTQYKPGRHDCAYCRRDLRNETRLECAEASGFEFCVECFRAGVKVRGHGSGNKYRVIDGACTPILESHWDMEEELLLLEALILYGYGNWADVSSYIGTAKCAKECEAHYRRAYLDSPDFPLPRFPLPAHLADATTASAAAAAAGAAAAGVHGLLQVLVQGRGRGPHPDHVALAPDAQRSGAPQAQQQRAGRPPRDHRLAARWCWFEPPVAVVVPAILRGRCMGRAATAAAAAAAAAAAGQPGEAHDGGSAPVFQDVRRPRHGGDGDQSERRRRRRRSERFARSGTDGRRSLRSCA